MPKENYIFKLEKELHSQLKIAAAQRSVSMSALVEDGIRHVLALPSPERPKEAPAFELTRTEDALLHELTKAGPGWHKGYELIWKVGVTFNVGHKAFLSLERRGKIYRWGDAGEFSNGRHAGFTWGLQDPRAVMRALVEKIKVTPLARARGALMDMVDKLAPGLSVELLNEFRPQLWAITRTSAEVWPLRSITEDLAAAYARERQRTAAEPYPEGTTDEA